MEHQNAPRRTLVLDIGGVFYLAKPDAAFWRRWAETSGLEAADLQVRLWHSPDIERANIGEIDAAAYYQRSATRLGLPPPMVRAMVEALFLGELNHAFIAFVRHLRAAGVPVSALTNSWSSEGALKARPEFAGLFDQVISSADVGATKPGEAIYRIAMQRLGLAAREIVFLDDTAQNVTAALALGWTAIRFDHTEQAMNDLGALYRAP